MSSLIELEKIPTAVKQPTRRGADHSSHINVRVGFLGTLRGRLVAILVLTNFVAIALTGAVIILKARKASQIEIDSSTRLAELLVTDTMRLMNVAPASLLLKTIVVQFQAVRHVRIIVADQSGQIVWVANSRLSSPGDDNPPPEWFARLVAPPLHTRVLPVLLRDRLVGNVTISSQPSDEIGEAWSYAEPIFVVGSLLNMAVLLSLFVLYGRVLAPLAALADGLDALQSNHYRVQLKRPSLQELAQLTDRFNRTADVLASTSGRNRELHRKLLTAQDDERRRMALELHDEVGPCLFALDVNASSIVTLSRDAAADHRARVHERAETLVALVREVQGINRRVLDQLRPIGLGKMALRECLNKLLLEFVGDLRASIDYDLGPIADSYGPVVDLTVYRCVQEGLLNAVKHADANQIVCRVREIEETRTQRSLKIDIRDDGKGLAEQPRSGIGLAGMRERIEALNGTFELKTSTTGTHLAIAVPADGETGHGLRLEAAGR